MKANEITDRESLGRWLQNRPIEDARVIAARAALRTLPMLSKIALQFGRTDGAGGVILSTFASSAAAWCASTYPHREPELKGAASLAWNYAEGAGDHVDAYDYVKAAVRAAAVVGECDRQLVAFDSIAAVDAAAELAGVGLWNEVRGDAISLELGMPCQSLATSKLFKTTNSAENARNHWSILKRALSARPEENWSVWLPWFEARLSGEPTLEEADVARISVLCDEEFEGGPESANARINAVLAQFPDTAPKGKAFLSHATQTDGACAKALVQQLEFAGTSCWIAPRDIPAGADWNGAILSAIDACGAMLVLVSDASLQSPFVKAEVQHALDKRKPVLPICLAANVEPEAFDLRLKVVQRVDFYTGEADAVARIVAAVRAG